jgi:hypothetical protein
MTIFPLFDSLNKDNPKKDLSVKEKEEFINKIQDIDDSGRDLIYALIQFYHNQNEEEKNSDTLPYKGIRDSVCKGKEDMTWSFTDFPIKLRHILYKFIKMHFQSMEEEKERQKRIM